MLKVSKSYSKFIQFVIHSCLDLRCEEQTLGVLKTPFTFFKQLVDYVSLVNT